MQTGESVDSFVREGKVWTLNKGGLRENRKAVNHDHLTCSLNQTKFRGQSFFPRMRKALR